MVCISLDTCSVHDLPFLKPAWLTDSLSSFSRKYWNLPWTIFSISLEVVERRLIGRKDSVSAGSLPGLGMVTISPNFHSLGHIPASHDLLKSVRRAHLALLLVCLSISFVIVSAPGLFPFFVLYRAMFSSEML